MPCRPEIAENAKDVSDTDAFWAVQTGSFSQEASAEALVERIRAQGFSARIETVELTSGRFHRVFANGFFDKAF